MDFENIDASTDADKQFFFEQVSNGFVSLDGVMSPLTRELVKLFQADGVDMTFGWVCTPMDWTCPACGRKKREIVRLNTHGDLMCRLVKHHDHMKDLIKDEFKRQCKLQKNIVADEYAKRFAERSSQMISAYDNAIICDDCNAADPKAKAAVGTHRDFSYSPQEIRRFVRPKFNAPHEINVDEARRIWEENKTAFALRLKIVDRIASIAANNTHWYQELPYAQRAETVFRQAESIERLYGVHGAIHQLAGERRRLPRAEASAWRRVTHKRPSSSPRTEDVNYLAHISRKNTWGAVEDSWRCSACNRTKFEVVRKSNKRDWSFILADRSFYAPGERYDSKRAVLCGDCGLLASNLGKEACLVADAATESNFAQFLTVSDIARVVQPQPHGRHNVRNDVADELVMELVERIKHLEQQDD